MKNLQKRFEGSRHLSGRFVMVMDITLSTFASCTIYLLLSSLYPHIIFGSGFFFSWIGFGIWGEMLGFLLFKTYRRSIRHSTLIDVSFLIGATVIKGIGLFILLKISRYVPVITNPHIGLLLLDVSFTVFLLFACRAAMVFVYNYICNTLSAEQKLKRALIVGTDAKAISMLTRLYESKHFKVVGFLMNRKNTKEHRVISGQRVYTYQDTTDLGYIRRKRNVDALLFPESGDNLPSYNQLINDATANGIKCYISPGIDKLDEHGKPASLKGNGIREVKIEDLLGRSEIKINMEEIIAGFKGKTILVTGAAGSIGSELCRQLAGFGVAKLVLFDNAETPMHNLRLELEESFPQLEFNPVIGDVRLEQRLDFAFRKYRPQVVFHAAAYKHVPLMEENPCEAVLVNVIGTRYVSQMCLKYGIERMVMISTDKAVNPTNIMGCTKRLAEIYVQSLGLAIERGEKEGSTRFVTTRFGNVLGSNGSVIPHFREQIEKGGPVTVTHPEITRFFMTIPEACRLVMEAATMTTGNQIFVFDMGESVKIAQLATRMVKLSGLVLGKDIDIVYTGLRPGEKLYEEVLANNENTLPTSHERIRIAKVREYDFQAVSETIDRLNVLSRNVEIPEMVKLMKETVPEFKSKNSPFEQYDRETEKP